MATTSDNGHEVRTGVRNLHILDLPSEVQKEIARQCSQSDLICLSLVSHYFRELAAQQLYRNYHIVFPDEDDPAFDSPIDGLAAGLETFVTSDYDYARHLRDISLDTLSGGDKAAIAYRPYLYNVSCGKFMNTLLLLTIRKAKLLETFKWNIRVELSRQVFKALHDLENLKHLHLRLQAGPSLYEIPPNLPIAPLPVLSHPPPPPIHVPSFITPPPPPPPAVTGGLFGAPTSQFYLAPSMTMPPPPPPPMAIYAPKPPTKSRVTKKSVGSKEPPTLSGFKKLNTLAVLDIDNLDMVVELKTCIRNSSGTLKKLKLSFSDALARQARRPVVDPDPLDSEDEDDFQGNIVPPPVSHSFDDSTNARAHRAQEEKKSQESVLGRIFDLEHLTVSKPSKKRNPVVENKSPAGSNPGEEFIDSIKKISGRLLKDLNGSNDFTTMQQDILDTIEAAARKYVNSDANKEVKVGESSTTAAVEGTSAPAAIPPVVETVTASDEASTSTSKMVKTDKDDVSPEDINIEEPLEQTSAGEDVSDLPGALEDVTKDDLDTSTDMIMSDVEKRLADIRSIPKERLIDHATSSSLVNTQSEDDMAESLVALAAQEANFEAMKQKVESMVTEQQAIRESLSRELAMVTTDEEHQNIVDRYEARMRDFAASVTRVEMDITQIKAETRDARTRTPAASKTAGQLPQSKEGSGAAYLRSTRGIAVRSLGIHLVPVRASVLSRALDLRALNRLTLLNVGPQAPIWAMLAKENKTQPLALRKIYTDNVSVTFLSFVAELPAVHELFMLERSEKAKPESFAAKTNTTIDHIRKLVLKKHLPTLKKLMITNQQDLAWDVDAKTMLLLCRKGEGLEELAISMGIKTMHFFLRHIYGLTHLRALHVVKLRSEDTCVWVMRETKRFLIDALSHYPDMKLEWLSINDEDDTVGHIIRVVAKSNKSDANAPGTKSKQNQKKKGKGIAKTPSAAAAVAAATGTLGGVNNQYPVLSLDSLDVLSESSDSDEENEEHDSVTLETIENIHFFDAWGVRIFKKEVMLGRL